MKKKKKATVAAKQNDKKLHKDSAKLKRALLGEKTAKEKWRSTVKKLRATEKDARKKITELKNDFKKRLTELEKGKSKIKGKAKPAKASRGRPKKATRGRKATVKAMPVTSHSTSAKRRGRPKKKAEVK